MGSASSYPVVPLPPHPEPLRVGEHPREHGVFRIDTVEDATAGLRREYLLYDCTRGSPGAIAVWLIHGTDEKAFDQELVNQLDGTDSTAWLDLALEHDMLIVLPQSPWDEDGGFQSWRPAGDNYRALWEDHIELIRSIHNKVHGRYAVSTHYLIGFSNGGLFVADLAADMPHEWSGVVNICGGLSYVQMERFNVPVDWLLTAEDRVIPDNNDCPERIGATAGTMPEPQPMARRIGVGNAWPVMLIVTGSRDDNCTASYRAARVLRHLGCDVTFWCFAGEPHLYRSKDTRPIWDFLQKITSGKKEN